MNGDEEIFLKMDEETCLKMSEEEDEVTFFVQRTFFFAYREEKRKEFESEMKLGLRYS
jgi:hypothetical protein